MLKKEVDRLIERYFVKDGYEFPSRYLSGGDWYHYDFESSKLLYSLVRHYKPTSALEFGACQGWTAAIINAALLKNGKSYTFVVAENERPKKEIMMTLHKELFGKKCPTYIDDVKDGPIPKKLDFVFIDTCHDEAITHWYLKNVFPRCVDGALIAIHDWPVEEIEGKFFVKGGSFPETQVLLDLYKTGRLPLEKLYWNYEGKVLTEHGLRPEASFWLYKKGGEMKKVLITGGSGFLGSHVIEEVVKRGIMPICFDRYLHPYPKPVHLWLGNVKDTGSVREAVNHADYVIHLAGILGTQETIKNPIPSVLTNIVGTVNVLNACIPTPFHQIQGVYIGVGNYWMNNSYSITKCAGSRFTLMYNKEHKTKMAVVRGLNAYGPRQKRGPVRKIIPTFVTKALKGENIEIYGDGTQIMDMIWCKDIAKILVDACVKDHGVYDKTFDAGTGRKTTVNWIAEQVIKATKSKSKIVHLPMRPGEPEKSVVLGDTKTLKPLGEYEFVPFEEGIKETVKWYQRY